MHNLRNWTRTSKPALTLRGVVCVVVRRRPCGPGRVSHADAPAAGAVCCGMLEVRGYGDLEAHDPRKGISILNG